MVCSWYKLSDIKSAGFYLRKAPEYKPQLIEVWVDPNGELQFCDLATRRFTPLAKVWGEQDDGLFMGPIALPSKEKPEA